jgi:hypothetical protein
MTLPKESIFPDEPFDIKKWAEDATLKLIDLAVKGEKAHDHFQKELKQINKNLLKFIEEEEIYPEDYNRAMPVLDEMSEHFKDIKLLEDRCKEFKEIFSQD